MDSASFFRDKSLGAESPISVSSSLLLPLIHYSICFISLLPLFSFNCSKAKQILFVEYC
uniref:Uncharacterized protein MANES_02G078600 n=1 Tax=Rhizophora mucronata TaxID=61149 RepID=A0A2P2M6L2_RHIMU